MTEKKEYLGKWWLPTLPNEKLFGKVIIDLDNKIELDIFGRFHDNNPDIILGISDSGELITLLDVNLSHCKISKLEHATYNADSVIFKMHFNDIESIRMKTFNIYFYDLENWTNLNSINRDCDFENRILHIDTVDFLQNKIFENDTVTIHLHNKCNWLQNAFPYRDVILKQSDFFIFDLHKSLSLDNVISKIIKPFKLFLTFCMSNPTSYDNITAYDENNNEFVIYSHVRDEKREKNKHSAHMVMPYSEISHNFQTYYGNWLDLIKKINPIQMLYFEIQEHSAIRSYHYRDFWILTVAIEAFHRCIFESSEYNEKEIDLTDLKEMLKDNLSDDDFNRTLKFLNGQKEDSLRSRLRFVIDKSEILMHTFLDKPKKRKRFVNKIVATRHFYTHYDISKKYDQINDDEFFDFLWLLMRLFEFLLLSNIGFNDNEILDIIKRHSDYKIFLKNFKK